MLSPVGSNDEEIEAQTVPLSNKTAEVQDILYQNGALPPITHSANSELVFVAEVPPVGYSAFRITRKPQPKTAASQDSVIKDMSTLIRPGKNFSRGEDIVQFTKGNVTISLSASTGRVTSFRSG